MDLKQFTALVTVSEVGSVTKAAQLLHLVQPAVTRQIRTLEEEIGVPLFERTRNGMVPTRAGEMLVERARRVLLEVERARAEISPHPTHVTGIVTLGLLESTVDLLAAPLAEAVASQNPGIELRILTAYSGHLQQWLDDGDIDLSLLYNLTSTPSLSVTAMLREPLWAVAGRGEPLRPDEPVTWDELWKRPLVLPVAGHGLRILIDEAMVATGGQPQVLLETNSMHVQVTMVSAGRGWTVLPAAGAEHAVAEGRLTGAPLSGPEVVRSVGLGLPRAGRLSPAVESVATELLRVTRSLVRRGRWSSAELTFPAS